MRMFALVSDQGTACSETALCEKCHATSKHRAAIERKAARDIPNPRDWHDCTGNEALECNDCGYPKQRLWVRVGDAGEYEAFDGIEEAVDYLNELNVGQVDHWIDSGPGVGFATPNYHGYDFISCFWGDTDANLSAPLDAGERAAVECCLEEVYL